MHVRVIGLRGWFAEPCRQVPSQLGGGDVAFGLGHEGVLVEGTRCIQASRGALSAWVSRPGDLACAEGQGIFSSSRRCATGGRPRTRCRRDEGAVSALTASTAERALDSPERALLPETALPCRAIQMGIRRLVLPSPRS